MIAGWRRSRQGMWSIPPGEEVSGPELCAGTINAICFGPDRLVYLSSWDGNVRRVRMSADGCSYELLEPLSGHAGGAVAATLFPLEAGHIRPRL